MGLKISEQQRLPTYEARKSVKAPRTKSPLLFVCRAAESGPNC